MDVGIVVATFGDQSWYDMGHNTAVRLFNKFNIITRHEHSESLHVARNTAATRLDTEWLCFVDADDDLEPGYFDAMEQATADLRAPAVKWVYEDRVELMSLADRTDIEVRNPCVIGTLIRKDMFLSVGGFKDWWAYEDWALFLSCVRRGATIEHTNAVYVATVRPQSRNKQIPHEGRLMTLIRQQS